MSQQLIHRPISRPAVPPAFSQVSEWKQLHTFVIRGELRDDISIQNIAKFLKTFHPPALQDVTVQFRVVRKDIIYTPHKDYTHYIDACLNFEAALSQFPRARVTLSGSSELHARKHLWMAGLGPLFPALRDANRLTIDCEPCEIRAA